MSDLFLVRARDHRHVGGEAEKIVRMKRQKAEREKRFSFQDKRNLRHATLML